MQHRWICIVIFYKAYASSPKFQAPPSFSDSFNNLAPDSSGFLASCGSELPADLSGFDISNLISREVSDSGSLGTSSNMWDLEDLQNSDDLWGSGSVGEPELLSDLATDPGQFAFNDNPPQNERPSSDFCSTEPPAKDDGGWKPPWIPIDPGQPDRDCLDDDWEKFCCPLGIFPLAGTDGCVACKASALAFFIGKYINIADDVNIVAHGRQECTSLFNIYCCFPEQEDVSCHQGVAMLF